MGNYTIQDVVLLPYSNPDVKDKLSGDIVSYDYCIVEKSSCAYRYAEMWPSEWNAPSPKQCIRFEATVL